MPWVDDRPLAEDRVLFLMTFICFAVVTVAVWVICQTQL